MVLALVGALRDHRVVGHRADAARHVGHAHRVGDELAVHQRASAPACRSGRNRHPAWPGRCTRSCPVGRRWRQPRREPMTCAKSDVLSFMVSPSGVVVPRARKSSKHGGTIREPGLSARLSSKLAKLCGLTLGFEVTVLASGRTIATDRPCRLRAGAHLEPAAMALRRWIARWPGPGPSQAGVALLARKKRSPARARSGAGMPGPSSTTARRASPGSRRDAHRHLAAARCVAHGVVQQVRQRLLQQRRLGRDPHRLAGRARSPRSMCRARVPPSTTRAPRSSASATRSIGSEHQFSAVGARQRQHLVGLAHRFVELGLDAPASASRSLPGSVSRSAKPTCVASVVSGVRNWCEASSTKRRRASLSLRVALDVVVDRLHQRLHVGRDAGCRDRCQVLRRTRAAPRCAGAPAARSAQPTASTSRTPATSTSTQVARHRLQHQRARELVRATPASRRPG